MMQTTTCLLLAVCTGSAFPVPIPGGCAAENASQPWQNPLDPAFYRFDSVVAIGIEGWMVPCAANGTCDEGCSPTARDWFNASGVWDPCRNGGNAGSGALIGEDLVVTARHIFSSLQSDQDIGDLIENVWTNCSDTGGNFRRTVRFRRNYDGTVGTMLENPIPAPYGNGLRGPASFTHHPLVTGYQPAGDPPDLVVLEIGPDHLGNPAPVDPIGARHWRVRDSFSIGGSALRPQPPAHLPTHHAGWGASETLCDLCHKGSGQLRWQEGTFGSQTPLGVGNHDSGSPVLLGAEAGGPIIIDMISATYESLFDLDELRGRLEPISPFDLTGPADPAAPWFGVRDQEIDLNDAVYASRTGVYPQFLSAVRGQPSTWTFSNEAPLLAADADIDGDGRLTPLDLEAALAAPQWPAMLDFNADGIADPMEANAYKTIINDFGHGFLGAVASSQSPFGGGGGPTRPAFTAGDLAAFQAASWDESASVTAGQPGYILEFDDDLNGALSAGDKLAVAWRLIPGDLWPSWPYAPYRVDPDGSISTTERLHTLAALLLETDSLHTPSVTSPQRPEIDIAGAGADALSIDAIGDGVVDHLDIASYFARHHAVFGPGGYLADPRYGSLITVFTDPNGDGRMNTADFEWLSAQTQWHKSTSPEALEFDLNGDGVFTVCTPDIVPGHPEYSTRFGGSDPGWLLLYILRRDLFPLYFGEGPRGFSHGILGDYDNNAEWAEPTGSTFIIACDELGGATPSSAAECADYDAMIAQINSGNDIFDGRSFFDAGWMSLGDADRYKFRLDADLDGDNDEHDYLRIIYDVFELADVDRSGGFGFEDMQIFLNWFSAGDLRADVNANGALTIDDVNEFIGFTEEPSCP